MTSFRCLCNYHNGAMRLRQALFHSPLPQIWSPTASPQLSVENICRHGQEIQGRNAESFRQPTSEWRFRRLPLRLVQPVRSPGMVRCGPGLSFRRATEAEDLTGPHATRL